jgi:hypothetical protein
MEDKFANYVGRFKEVSGQYGTFHNVALGPQDLEKLNKWAAENNGWVNLTLSPSKSGGLSMKKNDFKPTKQGDAPAYQPSAPSYQPSANEVLAEVNGDDLPF